MATAGQARLPRRAEHVISRELDGEFVVLNTKTDEAHQFDGAVAAVWRATEGGAVPTGLDVGQIDDIVAHLIDLGLLVEESGTSRRALMRAGAAGGAALAVAGIQSLVLPQAAWAGSNDLPFVGATTTFNVAYYVKQISVTIKGGGGGKGADVTAKNGTTNAGGAGGQGGGFTVVLNVNQGISSGFTTFTWSPGAGGAAGTIGGTGFGTAASGYKTGGAADLATGAGGGGGSSALSVGGVPILIAGGGAGGGGANDNGAGGAGGRGGWPSVAGTASGAAGAAGSGTNAGTPGGTGGSTDAAGARAAANGTNKAGGGGGGAGGGGGGVAGTASTNANGAGAGGGGGQSAIITTSFPASIAFVSVTALTAANATAAGQPGSISVNKSP